MTGCGIMSNAWGMILQWRSTIKVSIELPVATRDRRDMKHYWKRRKTRNKQQQQHKWCAHYTSHSRHTNQTLRFDPCLVQLGASWSLDSGVESLLKYIYHLTERDTLALHQIYVKNRGQDNVTNINTGSGVRRIIFKRQQCMYKSEQ